MPVLQAFGRTFRITVEVDGKAKEDCADGVEDIVQEGVSPRRVWPKPECTPAPHTSQPAPANSLQTYRPVKPSLPVTKTRCVTDNGP